MESESYLKLLEKERQKLKEHVDRNHESRWIKKGQWELKCWLGKRPTGRLFRTILTDGENIEAGRWQLANDMWDYLFTEKGERIIRAEYEREHGKAWQSKLWLT